MNGNELNNMAQRYKEEMMRLYRKSSTQNESMMNSSNQAMNMQNNMSTGSMTRDIYGTPISGTPGASNFNLNNNGNSQQTDIPVNCTCRFPSAESILGGLANTPTTLPITPEDNPPPAYPGNTITPIMPRDEYSNAANGARSTSAVNSGNVEARGIFLNQSPTDVAYDVPSQAENEEEILPDFTLPADLPAESSESVPYTANFSPSISWISLTGDNSWGFLQFDVFTAAGAIPIQGALVTVRKKLPGGLGLVRILFTDRSGRTPTIALPAPSQSYSQNPGSGVRPFSEYTVTVRASGYYTIRDINIPIFAGVKTVQPIDLIPLPQYGTQRPQPRTDGNSMTDSPAVG